MTHDTLGYHYRPCDIGPDLSLSQHDPSPKSDSSDLLNNLPYSYIFIKPCIPDQSSPTLYYPGGRIPASVLSLKALPLNRSRRIYRNKWSFNIKASTVIQVTWMAKWNNIPLIPSIYNLNMSAIRSRTITPCLVTKTSIESRLLFPVIQP